MAQFSHVNVDTRYTLFKTFCLSVYGSQLWNFESPVCEKFYIAWRKCIRKLFKLNYRTHSQLLPYICEDMPIDVQLHCRFGKFVNTCLISKNDLLRIVSNNAIGNPLSNLSSSLNVICYKYDLNKQCKSLSTEIKKNYFDDIMNIDHGQKDQGVLIKDLLRLNDNQFDNDIFEIVNHLCCT